MRIFITLVLASVAHAAGASTPHDYAVNLPIETQGDSAAWQIELDANVYAWTRDPALRDIAVFNADGQAVPIDLWRPARRDRVGEQRANLVLLPLPATSTQGARNDLRLLVERDANGHLRRIETADTSTATAASTREWLLDAGAFENGIDALDLNWSAPADGVIARFAVDASEDLQTWRSVRGDAAIVLLQQDAARIERRAITLDGSRAKYLRLRRLDAAADLLDLRVDGIRGLRDAQHDPLQWTDAEPIADANADAGTSPRRHHYALPAALPIEALRVELVNDNALAAVVVSTPAATTSAWNERARFVAFRLRQGDVSIDNGDIALAPAGRSRELRLDASTALNEAPRLAVGWRGERLLFLAEGRGPFVLAVGHARERRSATPLNAAVAAMHAQFGADWQPPLAKLGAVSEAAGASALRETPAPYAWRRWVLWGVLVAGAALVGAIGVNLLRGKR